VATTLSEYTEESREQSQACLNSAEADEGVEEDW
jgi:hypothetical protein